MTVTRRLRRIALALALAVAALAGDAAGAPPRSPLADALQGEAKQAYEDGKIAYRDDDFEAALVKFDKAHALSSDPRLLWNMAACHKGMRRYARVAELLDRYLNEGGDALSDADRQRADKLKEAIARFVSHVSVAVDVSGADVFVDGERAGKTPLRHPLVIDMGTRRIRVAKHGYRERTEILRLAGGSPAELDIHLVRASGRLQIAAAAEDEIMVDGRKRGVGRWTGKLPVGDHVVEVRGSDGASRRRKVSLEDRETERVELEDAEQAEDSGVPLWLWIGGSVALTAGAVAVTSYFVLRPDAPPEPSTGTLGRFELP